MRLESSLMLRNCEVSHMIEVPRLHRAVSWVVSLLEPFGLHSRFVSTEVFSLLVKMKSAKCQVPSPLTLRWRGSDFGINNCRFKKCCSELVLS